MTTKIELKNEKIWVDHERGVCYEYETANPDVLAGDLTDMGLLHVTMGGL